MTGLSRHLSLTLVTFYGVGTILGAGIYVLVGKVAGDAGLHTPLAFLLASVLAGFSAFSYTELASRYPCSAGEAVYIQQGIGIHQLSIVVGLLIVAAGILSIGTLLHGFAGYLRQFIDLPVSLIVIVSNVLLGLVVIWGIRQSVLLASLMTIFEVLGLLIILWAGREAFTVTASDWQQLLPTSDWSVWLGIFTGSFIAFYAFIGFEDIVNVAEEVIDPQRNLPRAIIISLVVTTLLYFLVAVVAIFSLAQQELAGSEAPLALLYERVTGQSAWVISLISLVSVINGVLIQMIMVSRVLYGMSNAGWLPARLAYVHPRTRTPLVASLVVMLLVGVFALILPLLSLAKLSSFVTLVIFTLINLSLWRIKLSQPAAVEIFQVPLWVPVSGFFLTLIFLIMQLF